MIKSVIFDKSNFDKSWVKNSYGLLLGQKLDNKLNAFLALECPVDPNHVVSDDINILKSINPKWVSQHFINVFRMLPGNAHVIGCYCVCDQQSFNDEHVISILHGLWVKENKLNGDFFESSDSVKIFLFIDPISMKFHCKKIDFQDDKSLLKNVEIKYSPVLSEYKSVQSNIAVRIDTIMPSEHDKDLILKQLKDSVNPFISDFTSKSIMLVNGQHIEGSAELGLYNEFESEKNKDSSCGDMINDEFMFVQKASKLDLMFIGANMQPTLDSSFESDTDTEFEIINRVKIQGRIPGVAFLSLHSTVKEAELALKRDLVRSIYSRLELLTEELHITGGEMEVSQILFPQRVKVSLPFCSNFPLSDYKFLSETATDVIARVRYFCRPPGMTDEELDINCIDIGIERSEQTSLEDELSEVELLEEKDLVTNSRNQTGGIIYFIGLSALIFCISAILYYFLN